MTTKHSSQRTHVIDSMQRRRVEFFIEKSCRITKSDDTHPKARECREYEGDDREEKESRRMRETMMGNRVDEDMRALMSFGNEVLVLS